MSDFERTTLFIAGTLIAILLALSFYEINNNAKKKQIQKIKTEKCLTSIGKIEYVNGETIIKFDDSISSYTYSLTHSEWK